MEKNYHCKPIIKRVKKKKWTTFFWGFKPYAIYAMGLHHFIGSSGAVKDELMSLLVYVVKN